MSRMRIVDVELDGVGWVRRGGHVKAPLKIGGKMFPARREPIANREIV